MGLRDFTWNRSRLQENVILLFRTVTHFFKVGMPITKIDDPRSLIEMSGIQWTVSAEMRRVFIPKAREFFHDVLCYCSFHGLTPLFLSLFRHMAMRGCHPCTSDLPFSLFWDGATRLVEMLAIVVRTVTE
jgi:hypothetical protein